VENDYVGMAKQQLSERAHYHYPPFTRLIMIELKHADQKNLFEPQLGLSELNWDFDPQPPTNQWTRNQALIFTRIVMARPLHYQVELGLYDPKTEEKPASRVKTEWVDFSSIK